MKLSSSNYHLTHCCACLLYSLTEPLTCRPGLVNVLGKSLWCSVAVPPTHTVNGEQPINSSDCELQECAGRQKQVVLATQVCLSNSLSA